MPAPHARPAEPITKRCRTALPLLLLVACHPTGSCTGIIDLEATLSPEVTTVVKLSWTSELPGHSWVEYGLDEQRLSTTPTSQETDLDHTQMLFGLPAFSTVHYEVFTEADGILQSQQGQIETGGLPGALPDFEVSIFDREAMSPEPWVASVILGLEDFLIVLDRQGQVVWYSALNDEFGSHMVMSLDITPDRRTAVFGAFSETRDIPSHAIFIGWDGEEHGRHLLGAAHHDLAQHPSGVIATLRSDRRIWRDPATNEDVEVAGDTLVEIAPTGEVVQLFNAWDWAEPFVHDNFYHADAVTADWTHANAVNYYADTDTYLMSLANLNTILEISASSGEILREFGPDSYTVIQGSTFAFQHDPHWTEAGTLLMSSNVPDDGRLMAIEYRVDDESKTLEEVWAFGAEEDYISVAGGQAIRMSNGNTTLNTGYNGMLVEAAPNGEPVWELASSIGGVFISAMFFDDFYGRTPDDR